MKKITILFFNLFVSIILFAQTEGLQKVNTSSRHINNELILKGNKKASLSLSFNLESYYLKKIDSEKAFVIEANNMSEILEIGNPHLPSYSKSVICSGNYDYYIKIISSEYIDIKDIKLAPSKGNLTRDINPNKVAYTYGKTYSKDEFYPNTIAKIGKAYILRDKRGQSISINPIQYNPVTKTLRLYKNIQLELIVKKDIAKYNVLSTTKSGAKTHQFNEIYKSHFLNFQDSKIKYTALNDNIGNMLIICYSEYMNEMQDFVNWKIQRGIPVEMVNISDIGNSSAIKTYVQNYYNNKGLTYLLLVGDNAQVPTSSTSAGDSDNNYGYLSGTDHYIDIFVGRFSGENPAEITTQVERSIFYERDLTSLDTWLELGVGIASNEGSSPSDAQHMNTLETKLTGYGYTIDRCYQEGGSANQLEKLINKGVGLINYIGHGSDYGFASMLFDKNDVNALTNHNKLPFIFDVACVNGNFKTKTCFAESWLRATNNGLPTGAIAICASTINQSWVPPMIGQNEMNEILIESYENNIKRSYTGITLNGMFKMIDVYGSVGAKMADTWTIFGDPSLQIRTKTPAAISPQHTKTISTETSKLVIAKLGEGAIVCLSKQGEIISTKKATNGSVNLSFPSFLSGDKLTLTITQYNKIPYISEITVGGTSDVLKSNFSVSKTSINLGETLSFIDISEGNPTSWKWIFEGGSPSKSSLANPIVTYNTVGVYNVSLTVSDGTTEDTNSISSMITVNKKETKEYCTSTSQSCSNYEYISSVKFSNIFNNSTCNGYTNYSNIEANVISGQAYMLEVGIGRFDTSDKVSAWIDWNKDGVFAKNGEEYILTIEKNLAKTEIVIPADANIENYKMRIRLTYSDSPTPCDAFKYGEIEDYSLNISPQDYCTPSSSNFNKYEYIGQVQFANINNSSSYSSYTSYTNISANIIKGNSYKIEVLVKNYDNSDVITAWCDWNNDGDFYDANEQYDLVSSAKGVATGEILIPTNAKSGKLKMRLRVNYNSAADPCSVSSYGETEDYNIFIADAREGKTRAITNNAEFKIYPNPVIDNCYLEISGINITDNDIIVSNAEGKIVLHTKLTSNTLNLQELPSGVYIINVVSEGNTYTKKIIKL